MVFITLIKNNYHDFPMPILDTHTSVLPVSNGVRDAAEYITGFTNLRSNLSAAHHFLGLFRLASCNLLHSELENHHS